jgi:hypothetical protein
MTSGYFSAPLNLATSTEDTPQGCFRTRKRMKIALLALLDLALEAPFATPKSPSSASRCAVMTVK